MLVRSDPAFEGFAGHQCALVTPEGVVVSQVRDLFYHVAHDFAADLTLDGALKRGELALGRGEVAADGFSEALGLVLAGAVDQQGVEEDYISFFHLKIDPLL